MATHRAKRERRERKAGRGKKYAHRAARTGTIPKIDIADIYAEALPCRLGVIMYRDYPLQPCSTIPIIAITVV